MQFLITLEAARPHFLQDMTPEEGKVIEAHFAHVKRAFENGTLLMAGRRADAPFGIVVLEVPSEDAARHFLADDPAIRQGLFVGKLHPFRVAVITGQSAP
jgi:uncharacterized protein